MPILKKMNPGCCCSGGSIRVNARSLCGAGQIPSGFTITATLTDSSGNVVATTTAITAQNIASFFFPSVPSASATYTFNADFSATSIRLGTSTLTNVKVYVANYTYGAFINPASGFVCVGGCPYPVSEQMLLTDRNGQTGLAYRGVVTTSGPGYPVSGQLWGDPAGSPPRTMQFTGSGPGGPYLTNVQDYADVICPPSGCPTVPFITYPTGTDSTFIYHTTVTEVIAGCGGSPTSGGNVSSPVAMSALAPIRMGALAPSPTLRVGLISDWLLLGGAEAWGLSVIDSLTSLLGNAITWVGAVAMNGPAEPAMFADLSALLPVTIGGATDARSLAAQCDVILTWSVLDYAALYVGLTTPPRTVFACHLPSAWGSGTAALLGKVDAFVAVSQYAQTPIPSPLNLKSSVIWNAIDTARLTTARSRATVRANWGIAS